VIVQPSTTKRRARHEALQAARVADPLLRTRAAHHQAVAVRDVGRVALVAQPALRHQAPAGGRQDAVARRRIQLREEPRRVRRRRHEAARRRDGIARVVAGDAQALAVGMLRRVAAGQPRRCPGRDVGRGLRQAGGIDDVPLHPIHVAAAGDGLDHQAEQREAVVGVLELHAGFERLRTAQVLQHLLARGMGAGH
jgi:hypothetical protein